MAVNKLNECDFEKEIMNYNGTVLLDFYADWCGPCKMLSPIIEEISKECPDVKFFKVNVDDSPDLAQKFGIVSIPTLIAFKDGKVLSGNIGYCTKETVLEMIS